MKYIGGAQRGGHVDAYFFDPEQWKLHVDPMKDAEAQARAERLRAEIDARLAQLGRRR